MFQGNIDRAERRLSQPQKDITNQPGPDAYIFEELRHQSQTPLTGKRSYHVGKQTFSKEKREADRIIPYTHEYEHDLINREGPGPTAYQP